MPTLENDPKTQRRVLRQLGYAQQLAKAAGKALSIPDDASGVSLASIYAVRHALATFRRSEPKGTPKRGLLAAASVIALCSDKIMNGASPLSPNSHRSGTRPVAVVATAPTRAAPTVEDEIGEAFGMDDGEGDDLPF